MVGGLGGSALAGSGSGGSSHGSSGGSPFIDMGIDPYTCPPPRPPAHPSCTLNPAPDRGIRIQATGRVAVFAWQKIII